MKTHIGSKVTITLPNGLAWPGVVTEDETTTPFITRSGAEIGVTRAEVISLRTRLDGESYLALTTETVQFGYRPMMQSRDGALVGLDADENGAKFSVQALRDLHSASYSAWQAANHAARQTVSDADAI